ncbi:ABC-2 transporter permease [uncultured Dysosmobacter sp.]|uniref:ABC-2 transporter permease n=1 Tax=uncultured Dysosmobacter sp. TaxID=2591384 RepID=UPI002633F46B|nr:ABC-2 transporter permease [uncultured Dysosmobacter sp.]
MKGLIQKDFYVMRERIRPVNYALIAFAALAVLTYFRSVGAMYVSLFLPLILVGIPKTIMVYDTQCKWDKFAIALPATRKTIIASRYLFFTILAVVMSIISFALCVAAGLFFEELTLALCVKFSLAGFVIALFYGLLTIPTGYALGANGGSFTMMLSVMLVLAIAYILKKFNVDLESLALWLANYASIISVVVLAVIGAISYKLSVYFYTKLHS